MLIFIHTTLRARKSQRTEVWKCANYSANKCKCDGNRTPQQLYAPSHTILSNWRCLSEFAAHNKAKQTSERERVKSIECLFARLLWVVFVGEQQLRTCELSLSLALRRWSQSGSHIRTQNHSHSLARSAVTSLYISLYLFWFLCRRRIKKKLARGELNAWRGELNAMLSVASCVVSLVATVTTSSSAYGVLCTSSSSWSPSHSSSSSTLLIVVTVHTRRRHHCCRPRRRRRFFCGPYSHKKKSSYSSAVIGSKAAN